ncbi:hypothetical protein ACFL0H_10860 [Thermodesulfobacteriota bacterium]
MPKKFLYLRNGIFALLLMMAAVLVSSTPAFAQDVSFKGKTVRVLLNLGAKSAVSANYAVFAPFIAKYLPGKPKIFVESKPGGQGILGAAYLYKNVKPDGETMGTFAIISGYTVSGKKLPIDLNNFTYIGSTGQGTIVYARTDSGLKSAEDFVNPPKPIILGMTNPNATLILQVKVFLNGIGQKDKYKSIAGYRGMLGLLQAARSGEVNVTIMHAGQFFPRMEGFKKEGIIVPLMELGVVDKDGVIHGTKGAGVPTVDAVWRKMAPNTLKNAEYEVFRVLQLSKAISWLHALPPNTPEKYRKAWEEAIAAASKDPEYLALLAKRNAPPARFTDGETTRSMLSQIATKMKEPAVRDAIEAVFVKK